MTQTQPGGPPGPKRRPSGGALFLARRGDGLGARLCALLNAMALADAVGGRAALLWPDSTAADVAFNAIAPAAEIFDASFLARYSRRSTGPGGWAAPRPLSKAEAVLLDPAKHAAAPCVVIVPWTTIAAAAPRLVQRFPALLAPQGALFDAIRFSPPLEAARAAAAAVPLAAAPVGLHLRAGDIVYGSYRFAGRFAGKACPFPVAEALAERLRAGGTPLIVFGQDDALGAALRDRHGALLATDLAARHGFAKEQQALFDICLMARCREVHGSGQSAFCVLATRISGAPLIGGFAHWRALGAVQQIADALSRDPAEGTMSALQIAFSAWSGFLIGGAALPMALRIRFLDLAITHDPENLLYPLFRAELLYREGKAADAEAVLAASLAVRPRERIRNATLSSNAIPPPRDPTSPLLDTFATHAEAGEPMAAIAAAICGARNGSHAVVEHHAALFRRHRPATLAYLDDVLEARDRHA